MSSSRLDEALDAFRSGNFVLVYDADGREEETDFFIHAERIQPVHIRRMRKDGGGLIFLMVHHDICEHFQLPFLTEIYEWLKGEMPVFEALVPNDIPYDTKSSFSLTINHRKTFTGITDVDRALTMREFGVMAREYANATRDDALRALGQRFRSPGHVPICRSSPNPLIDRFGHTELSVALALMAGLTPVVGGCEMMSDDHHSLPKADAKRYADEHGFVFLEGKDIVKGFREWSG